MKISHRKMNRQLGFSLIELMVAVVIGLIGTVVMFQVFAVSENQKRSTTSGNDAQQNGSIALFTLERDLRNSGHGMSPLINLGRPMYTWSAVNSAVLTPTIYHPVLITPGTGSNPPPPDAINVTYSVTEALSTQIPMTAPSWNSGAVPNQDVNVVTAAGIALGNQIAICPNIAIDPTGVCLRGEVTAIAPSQSGAALSLSAAPYTVGNDLITPRWNPALGFAATVGPTVAADGLVLPAIYPGNGSLAQSGSVINLGQMITRTYAIQNGQLTLNDGATTTEFANGIVYMRAQYGLDTTGTGAIDAWVGPRPVQGNPLASFTPDHPLFLTGTDVQIATSWAMVKGIRVAIVARSDNMEKEVVENRPTIPLWTNTNGNPAPSYTVPGGDGAHYRYRVFETIIPFRNMIWQ